MSSAVSLKIKLGGKKALPGRQAQQGSRATLLLASIWDHLPLETQSGMCLDLDGFLAYKLRRVHFVVHPDSQTRHRISSLCCSSWEKPGGPGGSMAINEPRIPLWQAKQAAQSQHRLTSCTIFSQMWGETFVYLVHIVTTQQRYSWVASKGRCCAVS